MATGKGRERRHKFQILSSFSAAWSVWVVSSKASGKHATVGKTSATSSSDLEAKHGGPGGSRGTGREAQNKVNKRRATRVQGQAFSLHKLPS